MSTCRGVQQVQSSKLVNRFLCKPCFLELESDGRIKAWGLCVEDCPADEPRPSCLNPPTIPAFGIHETEDDNVSGRFNYQSSWFTLDYLPGNETLYQITVEELERLHQPHWPYDDTNLTDEIQFTVENNTDYFNAAYKIVPEAGEVTYYRLLLEMWRNSTTWILRKFSKVSENI